MLATVQISNYFLSDLRLMTIDQANKILKRNGIKVSEDQAKLILGFLYVLEKTNSKGDYTEARYESEVFV